MGCEFFGWRQRKRRHKKPDIPHKGHHQSNNEEALLKRGDCFLLEFAWVSSLSVKF
jgi:hypothetical protein